MPFALSNMQVISPAFEHGEGIPTKHTGEGTNVSPALSWSGAPRETQSYAVICHDPDAPLVTGRGTYGFVHWVLYNIPGSVHNLPEGVSDYTTGPNDGGGTGWTGPMPPEGHGLHQYYFWVLALDRAPDVPAGLNMWDLLGELEPNILGMNRLLGTYERS